MSLLGLAILGRRNEPLYLCDCARALQEAKRQPPQRGNNRTAGPTNRSGGATSAGSQQQRGGSSSSSAASDDPSADAVSSGRFDHSETSGGNKAQEQDQGAGEAVESGADDGGNRNDDDLDPFGFLEAHRECDLGQSLSFDQSLYLHSALDYVEERIESSSAGLPVVTNGRTGHWLGRLVTHGDDNEYGDDNDLRGTTNPRVVAYGYITATNIKMLVLVEPPIDKESNVRLFLNGIHDSYISQRMNPFSSVKPGQRIQSSKFDAHIREAVRDYEDSRLQQ